MRRSFDETISVIRLAMARMNWLSDRQWLPWQDSLLLDPKDESVAEMCRFDVPGVLTFRRGIPDRTGASPDLVERAVVFVVGDTPTWGAHPRALDIALRDAAESQAPERRALVPVIGPAFSGGADSLVAAVSSVGVDRFHIVAGRANGAGLIDRLARSGALVSTTNVAQDALECAFWSHLRNERHADIKEEATRDGTIYLSRTAVLRESATAFGSGTKDESSSWHKPPADGPCPRPELELAFPMHVASVRNAYARMDGTEASNAIARRTHLDVDLAEESGTDEPSDASRLTASSRDAALSRLLRDVSSEGVDYLGIVASDIADALFLARKVRDVAPDVRLAFFANDILLAHPTFQRDLFGSYVVSAYPFLGSDEFSVVPFSSALKHVHLPFESDGGQATMNALVAGLTSVSGDTHGRSALSEFRWLNREGDARASEWRGPFVWISTVARDGIVPLVALDIPSTAGGKRPEFPACRIDEPVSSALACSPPWNGEQHLPCFCSNASRDECLVCSSATAAIEGAPREDLPARIRDVRFNLDEDVTPPNVWILSLAALAILALADWSAQRIRRRALDCGNERRIRDKRSAESSGRGTPAPHARSEPTSGSALKAAPSPRAVEIALLRSRYCLAAAFRSASFTLALLLGILFDAAAFRTYPADSFRGHVGPWLRLMVLMLSAVALVVAAFDTYVNVTDAYAKWRELDPVRVSPMSANTNQEPRRGAVVRALEAAMTYLGWRATRDAAKSELDPSRVSTMLANPNQASRKGAVVRALEVAMTYLGWRATRDAGNRVWAARRRASQQVILVLGAGFAVVCGALAGAWGSMEEWLNMLRGAPSPNVALGLLRTPALGSGASPAWPILCTFASIWFWTRMRMDVLWLRLGTALRASEAGMAGTALPLATICDGGIPNTGDHADGFALAELHMIDAAAGPSSVRHTLGLVFAVSLLAVFLSLKPVVSIEGPALEWSLRGALAVDAFLCLSSILHLVSYWRALRYLLARLAGSSLGGLLDEADPQFCLRSPFELPSERARGFSLVACARLLERAVPRTEVEGARIMPTVGTWELLRGLSTAASAQARTLNLARARDRHASAGTEGELVGPIVTRAAGLALAALGQDGARDARATDANAGGASERRAHRMNVRAVRRFVASTVSMFVARDLQVIGVLMFGIVAQAIVLLLAIEGYSFEPRRPLLTCVWLLMLCVAAVGVWILVEASKNEALSKLSGTSVERSTYRGILFLTLFAGSDCRF